MGDATNKLLHTLIIISLCFSIAVLGIVIFGKKTIQLTTDSSGTIHTGEMKQHLRFK
ncbi:MAG: hypothetical protein IT223_12515 [Crocinitomicaceae bacterium]|nr:hypothetical protein [Crocinitomicaceae bacterium]